MPDGFRLLGVRVDAASIAEWNARIASTVAGGKRRLIGCHNLHSVYLYHRDPDMRRFYDMADDIHIDGMSLVVLSRALGYRVARSHRVTWLDWIDPLLDQAVEQGWRVFYFGSRPGVIDDGARVWRERHPGLRLETAHGFIENGGKAANDAVLEKIRAYAPHILMVGMGQPRQEKWIVENWSRLAANVVLTPGACIDYASGAVPTPPRWMGRLGLEWFYRLVTEPRRLWRRYLLEPWFLLGLFARDIAGRVYRRQPHAM